jgi:hypothetical protein
MNIQIKNFNLHSYKDLFTSPNRITLCIVLCLFIILTALKLHGFSISMWHDVIDNSPKEELVFGKARDIRSDDWITALPMIFSQINHDPIFPLVNKSIGDGQNMLGLAHTPVSWIPLFFRPQSWGYILGPDYGMAWHWWFHTLGLFFTSYLIFMLVSRQAIWVSVGCALLLLYSPFFQHWSLNCNSIYIFGLSSIISIYYIVCSKTLANKIISAILLGWSGGCFIQTLYPPYQIPMGYLVLFISLGLIMDQRNQLSKKSILPLLILFAISIIIFTISAVNLYLNLKPALPAITQTVYPGQRTVTGGDVSIIKLVLNTFLPFRKVKDWGPFGNICEASGFIYIFPIIALVWIYFVVRRKLNVTWIMVLSVLYAILNLYWMIIGFPLEIAKITFMSMVPGGRTLATLGIVDLIIVAHFLGRPVLDKQKKSYFKIGVLFSIPWLIFLFFKGKELFSIFTSVPQYFIIGVSIWIATYTILILSKKTVGLFIMLAALLPFTFGFNPIVRGGYEYLSQNALSSKILELDKNSGHTSRWVTFNSIAISNLPRVLNANSISGVYFYPQMSIWKEFDKESKYQDVYNRFAHTLFVPKEGEDIEFYLNQADLFTIKVNPSNPIFRKLNINYFLVVGDASAFETKDEFIEVFSYQDKKIYTYRSDSPYYR